MVYTLDFDAMEAVTNQYLTVEHVPGDLKTALEELETPVSEAVQSLVRGLNLKEVCWIGVGGSYGSMFTADRILMNHAPFVATTLDNANELLASGRTFTADSLVIAASHSGSSAEVTEAAAVAKGQGAVVWAVTAEADSALARAADCTFVYEGRAASAVQTFLVHLLALHLARCFGSSSADPVLSLHRQLPERLDAAIDPSRQMARELADSLYSEPFFFVTGAATGAGLAYQLANIGLQEFSWFKAAFVPAGDFFHGPLEIADETMTYLLVWDNNERARSIMNRMSSFLDRVGAGTYRVDVRTILGAVDDSVSCFGLMLVNRFFTYYMAMSHGHQPEDKRYMGVIEY